VDSWCLSFQHSKNLLSYRTTCVIAWLNVKRSWKVSSKSFTSPHNPNWNGLMNIVSPHEISQANCLNCNAYTTVKCDPWQIDPIVATPLWGKCEDETHTPKSGNLESSGTLENLELDCRGQKTLHWGLLYTIGNFLKCKCPKWPQIVIWTSAAQVMVKRRVGSQTNSLTPDH
jgi:hypothetical protein